MSWEGDVMKVAGIRELRANTADLLSGAEPVLVTRHGKISGVYVPLEDPGHLPEDLRHELVTVLGRHLAGALQARGVTEEDLQKDFDAQRRHRR
jgi:antitoxin (DNA-binding transcriptional repressor) of toxin-antitoxin stability system